MVSNLYIDDAACGGEFRTTFRTIPAPVRLVRNSQALYLWGSGWVFSERLERETLFFWNGYSVVRYA